MARMVSKARGLSILALLSVGALHVTPAFALCPNCLGQSPVVSPTLKLVGIFLLVPAAVFFAAALVIRRLAAQSARASGPPSATPPGGEGLQGG